MILAQAYARFVFDLDGVIWRGTAAIPGAPETIRSLRDAGKRLCFVTNNSSETNETYAKRLADVGAGGNAEEVLSSADAAAHLLDRTVPGLRGRLTYVIGGEGLRNAVAATGARLADGEEGTQATLVVAGWDRDLTYDKLRIATLAIRSGATFVASNTDPTYPAPDGLIPGAGAIVAALRAATGVSPAIAGKPEPRIFELAAQRVGGVPALAVGDRISTDVAAARAAGWPSALVLTGATGVPELAVAPLWPDHVIRTLPELLEDRPHPRVRNASGPDLPPIAQMLQAGGLHTGAARERLGRTIVAEVDRRPIATAAWERCGDAALLRSVAVVPEHRGGGAGIVAVAAALRKVAESGLRDTYLVTVDAARFFERCGFIPLAREDLPAEVAVHPQVTRECPSTATAMRLRLPEPQ